MITYILASLIGIIILVADQVSKYWVANNLLMSESYTFLPKVIDITYIHNDGAAWGMLGGHTWFLLSMTLVVMLVCLALLLKYGVKDKLMFWAIILVLSGGLGNMIDRIFRGGRVIDFLHFEFWPTFPVFNIADCAIVVGAGLLMLYFFIGIIEESRQKQQAIMQPLQTQENEQDEDV